MDPNFSFTFLFELMFHLLPPSFLTCFLQLLRITLNEYSTGLCILFNAFFRFMAVCHPTHKFNTEKSFLQVACIGLLVLILAVFVPSGLYFYLYHGIDCFSVIYVKTLKQLLVEVPLCFLFPCVISAYMYKRVRDVLLDAPKHQKRNRNLSRLGIINFKIINFKLDLPSSHFDRLNSKRPQVSDLRNNNHKTKFSRKL